jgi:hypothetical protein
MSAVVVLSLAELDAIIERAAKKGAEHAMASRANSTPASGRRVLTVPVACRTYGIGRLALLAMINGGRLPATSRTLRGGHEGYVMRVEDLDRVLAGGRA